MGCMTSLYLNSIYPNLFAASLYVSGQWDINVLGNMENQTFFYITSQGDAKASGGQSEVMSMFDGDGASYTYGEWNCKDEDQNEKAQALIYQERLGVLAAVLRASGTRPAPTEAKRRPRTVRKPLPLCASAIRRRL